MGGLGFWWWRRRRGEGLVGFVDVAEGPGVVDFVEGGGVDQVVEADLEGEVDEGFVGGFVEAGGFVALPGFGAEGLGDQLGGRFEFGVRESWRVGGSGLDSFADLGVLLAR